MKDTESSTLSATKVKCTVKWFSLKRGYGFLEPIDGSSDIFMHFSLLEEAGYQHVSQGDEVVCDIGSGRGGTQVMKIYEVHSALGQPNQIPLVLEEQVGTVKWFNILRGYGFVQPDDDGRDIFVHTGSLKNIGVDRLIRGQRVKTKILLTERGREAREITILETESTPQKRQEA